VLSVLGEREDQREGRHRVLADRDRFRNIVDDGQLRYAGTVQLLERFSFCGIRSPRMSGMGADVGKVTYIKKNNGDEALSVSFFFWYTDKAFSDDFFNKVTRIKCLKVLFREN
jgi:hypothetical protein